MDRQFRGYDTDLVVGLRILLVEETSRKDDQVTDLFVFRVNPHNLQIAFFGATNGHSLIQRNHRRGGDDAANLVLDRFHVFNGQRVIPGIGDVFPAAFVFRIDPVRPDGLNLVQKVLLAREADGGDQDQGRGADHHAERGQSEPDLVAHKGLVGEAEDLAESKVGASVLLGWGIHLPG